MVANPRRQWMSVEGYLELERNDPNRRYEYLDGEVLAMAGGTIDHGRITLNVARWWDDRLKHPCHVHTSDIKVQLNATRYTYPDVHVSCEEVSALSGTSKYSRIRADQLATPTHRSLPT